MRIEQIAPPGNIVDSSAPIAQAPVLTDRSFLVGRRGEPVVTTPIDELTRLPLPLAPVHNPRSADMHHHFHPKKSPLLLGCGGLAVRNARLQKADYNQHHNYYHGMYAGPPLPATEAEQFATVIMSVAGYMPDQAITFKKGEPQVVTLSPDQRHQLQTSGEVRVGSVETVRKFIRQYVMSQNVYGLGVSDLTIEEFMITTSFDRRQVLGHTLLGLITDKATEHIDNTYYEARKRNLLFPGLPNNVRKFTKSSLGSRKMRDRLVKQLHSSIAA